MLSIAHHTPRAVVARISQGGLQDTVIRNAEVPGERPKVLRPRHRSQPSDPRADCAAGHSDLSCDLRVRDDAALTVPEGLDQVP